MTFEHHNASLKDNEAGIIRQLTDIDKKLERLEERSRLEELTAELYNKYKAKFKVEKQNLSNQMSHNRIEISKLEDFISVALMFSANLSKMWALGDYTQRQELQNALFQDGIVYDRQKDECRSTGNNEFISEILDLSKDIDTFTETKYENFNPSSPSIDGAQSKATWSLLLFSFFLVPGFVFVLLIRSVGWHSPQRLTGF